MYASEERIEGYGNKWHSHIFRADSSKLFQNIKYYEPDERRNIGCPRRRWKVNM
jgi:hypothetical protein